MRDGHMIKKKNKQKEAGRHFRQMDGRARIKRERKKDFFFFSSLLSKIYGNQTVDFCWRKRQSRSTHRKLRVGTKILEFRQTPRGREFSYLFYF